MLSGVRLHLKHTFTRDDCRLGEMARWDSLLWSSSPASPSLCGTTLPPLQIAAQLQRRVTQAHTFCKTRHKVRCKTIHEILTCSSYARTSPASAATSSPKRCAWSDACGARCAVDVQRAPAQRGPPAYQERPRSSGSSAAATGHAKRGIRPTARAPITCWGGPSSAGD